MPPTPTAPPLSSLLMHQEFVRVAARAVLHGDGEVEDVVQETWIRALKSSPRSPDSLRAWLQRVARHLAIDVLRQRIRRETRERSVARAEALPSVGDIAAKEEGRRRLVAAILALAEPSRTAVLLRWYEGLSVARVAARLEIPLETARSRLRRGLAQLRTALRAGDGAERDGWARMLLPWAAGPSWTTSFLGGLTMALAVKKTTAVALALLLLAGGALTWRLASERGEGERTTRLEPPTAPGASATNESPGGTPSLVGSPGARAPRDPRAEEPLPLAAGVVVDEQDRPLPGVAVVVRRTERLSWGDAQEQGLDFDQVLAHPTARTDGDGRFRVDAGAAKLVSLVFLGEGYAIAEVRGLSATAAENQALRVVLHPGGKLDLRAVDSEGRAVAGARVTLWLRPDEHGKVVVGWLRTDHEGRCQAGGLGAGEAPIHQLGVGARGYASVTQQRPDVREEILVRLKRTQPRVLVRDAASRVPLRGAGGVLEREGSPEIVAALCTEWPGGDAFQSPDGELLPFPWMEPSPAAASGGVAYVARVSAPGHVVGEATLRWTPPQEPPSVEILLEPGEAPLTVAGTVEPRTIRALELRMPMPKGWGAEQETGLPLLARVPVSADGTFEARGFPPGAYRLGATLPGFAPHYVDVSAPAEDLRLVFERAASLEVALRDAAGAPLAEAWVTVGIEGRSVDASRRTEEDGSVRFEGLPPGRAHVVPVQGGGVTRWEQFPPHATVDLVAGATAQVDLRALERHAITLRVRDSSGTAVEGADVGLKPRDGWSIVVQGEWERVVGSPGGTGGGWKGVTGTDGTAAIDLYAGAYAVTVRREGVARAIVVQVPDREGTIEVRWSSGSAVLGGRLTEDGTGLAVAGRTVWVTSQRAGEEREVLARTATDEQGRFEAGGLPAGAVRVDLLLRSRGPEAASDEASPYPTLSWETTLSPSSPTTRDISVPRVRGEGAGPTDVELTLRVLEAGGKPLAGVAWAATAERGGIAISLPAPPQTGADGRAIARVLAADRYRIFVVRRGPGGAALSEPFETEVTPVRGRAEVTATLQPLKRVER